MSAFLRNHWTYIIGSLVAGLLAWGRVTAQVNQNTSDILDLKAASQQSHDFITRQDELNQRLKKWLDRHDR